MRAVNDLGRQLDRRLRLLPGACRIAAERLEDADLDRFLRASPSGDGKRGDERRRRQNFMQPTLPCVERRIAPRSMATPMRAYSAAAASRKRAVALRSTPPSGARATP